MKNDQITMEFYDVPGDHWLYLTYWGHIHDDGSIELTKVQWRHGRPGERRGGILVSFTNPKSSVV